MTHCSEQNRAGRSRPEDTQKRGRRLADLFPRGPCVIYLRRLCGASSGSFSLQPTILTCIFKMCIKYLCNKQKVHSAFPEERQPASATRRHYDCDYVQLKRLKLIHTMITRSAKITCSHVLQTALCRVIMSQHIVTQTRSNFCSS